MSTFPHTMAVQGNASSTSYRISGHESFPCRYTWLPKAVRGLKENPNLLADDDRAMVALGLGKNMVRSVRLWTDNLDCPLIELDLIVHVGDRLTDR